jgi:hypothetical protein
MSQKRFDLKSEPELVIPYLKELFESIIPDYFQPTKMYLVGSRGRNKLEDWEKLNGSDWDILIETKHLITNTRIWGIDKGYHLEIVCNDKDMIDRLRNNKYHGDGKGIELFPNTPKEFKKFL